MSSAKVAARSLFDLCVENDVDFPSVMDESKRIQVCGATVMLHRNPGEDSFALNDALASLIEKYGTKKKASSATPKKSKKRTTNDEEEEEAEGSATKKPRKVDTVVVEANRSVAEAIKEMADISFKSKDVRKGGVLSKAAKALREAEFEVTSGKEAMKLKGIGKGIAAYIDEFIDTGSIQKLEEMRSGL